MAEISETESTFLDTKVYKGVRFNKDSILDVRTHFKPTETFQYTNFYSCHPLSVTKGFIKGEALRWLNTVLHPVSGNSRDGERFNLDKQTGRRKSNGKQKAIPQNLLDKIL